MAKDFSSIKLNKEQTEAVKFIGAPLLVIAGAGTGKTAVITERIKYLILSKKVKPNEILALTFTEKAAKEMEERVDMGLPYGYTQMWVMTFHSFCDRVLRREALNIGLDPKFKLMTTAESLQLIRKNIFNFDLNYFRPLGNPNKFIVGLLQHFSRLQDEDINPDDYINWVNNKWEPGKGKLSAEDKLEKDKYKELANAYKMYDELKTKEGLFDFGDLIVKTLHLFRTRPNVLRVYRSQFKEILVDEFQDTNYAQNELVKLLSQKEGCITVVADDDQSIYRFRGAAVSNVIQFRKSFPKAKIVVLSKNYRSQQEILNSSYALIQFNNPDRLEVVEKINKKLSAMSTKKDSEIRFIHADRVENESDLIAKEVLKLNDEFGYHWSDVAILVRANNHAEPIMRSLSRQGIPSQFLGPGKLFKEPEIVELISFLKVLDNPHDSLSFYKLLAIDYFEIPGSDMVLITGFGKKYNLSLYESAVKIEEIQVSEKTKKTIKKILEIIKKGLDSAKKTSAGTILYSFLSDSGLIQELLNATSPDAEKKAKNISKFFDKLKSYEADHEDSGVSSALEWIDLAMELGESPLAADTDWGEVDAVNILTVHSAKGLEFPVVFMVNLVAQRFPTIERREQIPIPEDIIKEVLPKGDYHIQEERRLFYVGMTRAKERLYFTAANFYGEGKREKKLSPFIFEALGKGVESSTQDLDKTKQLSFLDYQKHEVTDNLEMPKLQIDYLSFSQIETFKTCPLHYKLRYIYKLPTPPSASQSFGTSIHSVLKVFFEKVSRGEKFSDKFMNRLLEENWIQEGYLSKKQEEEFFEKGKIYLSGFLKQGFDPKNISTTLEQPFNIPLKSKDDASYITVGGKIDRVDVFPDGSIEIIDYKTGASVPSQKEVDKNLQLSFYALAATKIAEKPFGIVPEKIKLSLYYLDQQQKITTTRTISQLQKAEEEIFKIKKEIEESNLKCSGHLFCQTGCEFSLFCKSSGLI